MKAAISKELSESVAHRKPQRSCGLQYKAGGRRPKEEVKVIYEDWPEKKAQTKDKSIASHVWRVCLCLTMNPI